MLEETKYTLSLTNFAIDVAGTGVLQLISRCPGQDDVVTEVTSDIEGEAGPDFSGQAWTRDLDPANPGLLSGSASFTDVGADWVTLDVTWTLTRP